MDWTASFRLRKHEIKTLLLVLDSPTEEADPDVVDELIKRFSRILIRKETSE